MDRREFYYKQPVTEDELNGAFDCVENAMHELLTDQGLYGVFQGGTPSQHSPVAGLSVDFSGPLYAYDNDGERISWAGNLVTQSVSEDSNEVSTAVAAAGNEKYVSVFVQFERVASDPRVDGNSVTVYFQEDESYQIVVVQGAEAALTTASRPNLDESMLLLCDVHLIYGQTQVLNSDILTDRRQDTIVIDGTPFSIRAGTWKDGIASMLTNLNDHVAGLAGAHPATGITTTQSPNWDDATHVAAGHVQDYLDGIVTALASQTGSGAAKIGAPAVSGSPYPLAAGSLASQLAAIVAAINALNANVEDGSILPYDVADGVAQLDSGSRVPASLVRNGLVGITFESFTNTGGSAGYVGDTTTGTGWADFFATTGVTAQAGDYFVLLAKGQMAGDGTHGCNVRVAVRDGGVDQGVLASITGTPSAQENFATCGIYLVTNAGAVTPKVQFQSDNSGGTASVTFYSQFIAIQIRP